MLVDIVVFDGLDEMDALGPLEVLRSARGLGADVTTRLVTRLPQQEVRGAFGLRFAPDSIYEPGATMLLAHAGVVGTRWASTHHAAWSDLVATGAQLVEDRVVDDGDLVTSGGVTSGIDLALWLVERECSRQLADRVADRMEYVRARPADR